MNKKIELLAPAGNMVCLRAAIAAGCDAVYLGGNCFGARAFSKNFDDDELIEAINYAHLYGVKVYVTVNTLVYDDEVEQLIKYVEFLHRNNVDAIIMQDLGMFDLVRKTFPNLEVHSSTQMHIHNLDGTKLMESLGAKRVVLARETSIEEIEYIKKNSNIELEIFIHGALCISYSGQCLMSSLIGGRSGNRGTCAGSCRLKYDVIDKNGKKLNKGDYPLSTRDLNSLENIGKLIDIGVASLKIEGRMKSPEYVYMVVKLYRMAIDSYYKGGIVKFSQEDLFKLKKIFNREYTKGFLFNTENNQLINGFRPNHMGVKVGIVCEYKNNNVLIKLNDDVSIGSGLRVIGKNNDVGINVNNFYINGKLVKEAHKGDIISLKINDKVDVGSTVVITLDKKLNAEIDMLINNNERKVLIEGKFIAKENKETEFIINDGINCVMVKGNIVASANNKPVSKEDIYEKLNRLGDTVYKFNKLEIEIDNNIFIPISDINDIRRRAILELNNKRLYKSDFVKCEYKINVPNFDKERKITCLVNSGYDKLDRKYDMVYSFDGVNNTIKKLPRVIKEYPVDTDNMLVGDIGAFNNRGNMDTDFSLNVVNSYTVAFLHSLGAKKITLSYELNDIQIKNLINNYHDRYGVHPNLELIVSGYEEVMISKFNLSKYVSCDDISLKDMYGNIYKVINRDNLMYIYNYKKRDIFSNKYYDMGINSLRINLDI